MHPNFAVEPNPLPFLLRPVRFPRVPTIRDRRIDWRALPHGAQLEVQAFLNGDLEVFEVSLAGKVFLRRHHGK